MDIKNLERRANEGSSTALSILGTLYLYGDPKNNIEQDYEKAFKYLSKKADTSRGVLNLAYMYKASTGT